MSNNKIFYSAARVEGQTLLFNQIIVQRSNNGDKGAAHLNLLPCQTIYFLDRIIMIRLVTAKLEEDWYLITSLVLRLIQIDLVQAKWMLLDGGTILK